MDMMAALLFGFFAAAALLAIGAIATTIRRYGVAALALRSQLAACPQQREFRYTISEVQVRQVVESTLRRRARRHNTGGAIVRRRALRAAA